MQRSINDKKKSNSVLNYGNLGATEPNPSNILERTSEWSFSFATGKLKEIEFDNFHIGHCELSLTEATKIPVVSKTPSVEMEFVMEGNCSRNYSGHETTYGLKQNEHNLSFIKPARVISNWESSSGRVKLLQINIEPEYFLHFLEKGNQNHDSLKDFQMHIEANEYFHLAQNSGVITPKMQKVISQIISCKRQGMVKRVFLESRILYLLTLQLEQIFSSNSNENTYGLSGDTIKKLITAKHYLESNLEVQNLTLQSLARYVGTNEFTLKKGFKQLWGLTVFGFWKRKKMEKASELLIKRDVTIGEIAQKLGYKNHRHFSTAFKKFFGISPKDYRKNNSFSQ